MGKVASEPNMITTSPSLGEKLKKFFSSIFFGYFSYSTVREVQTHNFLIALMFRIMQLAVLVYVIGWDIVQNKSYQTFDSVSSTVTSKVKGLGYVNSTNNMKLLSNDFIVKAARNDYRMFDTADYVIPPSEYNSIFVMTNFVETRQTQDICLEDYTKTGLFCKSDIDCLTTYVETNNGNGIPTGKCMNHTLSGGRVVGLCEISAWCPVEIEEKNSEKNLINNIENFTILIKNDIEFKLWQNKRKRNILPWMNNSYLEKCRHSKSEPYCPILVIGEILKQAEPDPTERKAMLMKGGVIQIEIRWDCNLDQNFEKCLPKYLFERYDTKFNDPNGQTASGFNFRYADKFEVNGVIHRTLIKAYGLRFIIVVTGKGGKFDFIPLFLTIGAGIGLLAIPTLISDCILLNFTRKRKFYQTLKEFDYKSVENQKVLFDLQLEKF